MRAAPQIVIEFYAKTFRAFFSHAVSKRRNTWENCPIKVPKNKETKTETKTENETEKKKTKFIPGKFTMQFAINFHVLVLQFSGQFEVMKKK